MRKLAVINQKGGVAKTTTSVNLAAGLSRKDRKILLIDLDPQSSLEVSMNLDNERTTFDFLFQGVILEQCINSIGANLNIIKGDQRLLNIDETLKNEELRNLFNEQLKTITGYDYVIFDCAPSLNVLNKNILLYCKEVIIPTSTDYFGFKSLTNMSLFLEEFSDFNDEEIKISRIVPTFYDKRNKICNITLETMNNDYYQSMAEPIRINSKLKEAPKYKQSIFNYAPNSSGAKDYEALVNSVLSDEALIKHHNKVVLSEKKITTQES